MKFIHSENGMRLDSYDPCAADLFACGVRDTERILLVKGGVRASETFLLDELKI